jgi:hypothetical protein
MFQSFVTLLVRFLEVISVSGVRSGENPRVSPTAAEKSAEVGPFGAEFRRASLANSY